MPTAEPGFEAHPVQEIFDTDQSSPFTRAGVRGLPRRCQRMLNSQRIEVLPETDSQAHYKPDRSVGSIRAT